MVGFGVGGWRQRDASREHSTRVESQGRAVQVDRAAGQQARSIEKSQRQGNLTDDQPTPQRVPRDGQPRPPARSVV